MCNVRAGVQKLVAPD